MKLKGAVIPDAIVERVVARRGSEHCYADLDPARTALVVIDLQYAFMDEAVGHAVCPAALLIVPAVNRLAAAVRETGGGVFWVQMTHDARCLEDWSVAHEMASPAMREKRIGALSEGTPGTGCGPISTFGRKTRSSTSTATAPLCPGPRTCPSGCGRAALTPC